MKNKKFDKIMCFIGKHSVIYFLILFVCLWDGIAFTMVVVPSIKEQIASYHVSTPAQAAVPTYDEMISTSIEQYETKYKDTTILIDNRTGVCYLKVAGQNGASVTPMYNDDGSLRIIKSEE